MRLYVHWHLDPNVDNGQILERDMQLSDWMTFIRLSRARFNSDADYTRFQAFQGEMILTEIAHSGIRLDGRRVLDLGCGKGGYSVALAARANQVVAIDRYILQAQETYQQIRLVQADAVQLPFGHQQFDFVMCASLIEHLTDPLGLLREIRRVLSPQGICYLSFPPFYSPVGGHQFKPYHLLGEKLAIRLSGFRDSNYQSAFGQWGLYRRTIRGVRRLVGNAGLEIQSVSTRYMPFNFAALPVIGEFLTWHVQFILTRPDFTQ